MVERSGQRNREAEPGELISDAWDRIEAERQERLKNARVIIRGKDQTWEQNRQALIKVLLWDALWEQVGTPGWHMFIQNIKTHSGRHTHQGGLAIFILEGKGYTVIDSVRYDWEEGDLILLPIKPGGGSEHQHFNLNPDGSSYWMAFIYIPMRNQFWNQQIQNEKHPDWPGAKK